jgi:hypothetical protein
MLKQNMLSVKQIDENGTNVVKQSKKKKIYVNLEPQLNRAL